MNGLKKRFRHTELAVPERGLWICDSKCQKWDSVLSKHEHLLCTRHCPEYFLNSNLLALLTARRNSAGITLSYDTEQRPREAKKLT